MAAAHTSSRRLERTRACEVKGKRANERQIDNVRAGEREIEREIGDQKARWGKRERERERERERGDEKNLLTVECACPRAERLIEMKRDASRGDASWCFHFCLFLFKSGERQIKNRPGRRDIMRMESGREMIIFGNCWIPHTAHILSSHFCVMVYLSPFAGNVVIVFSAITTIDLRKVHFKRNFSLIIMI